MSEKNSTSQLGYMPFWPGLSRGKIKTYAFIINQAWGQDGWILDKFFFCDFNGREEVEVNKNQKKTERAWSTKDVLHGQKKNFSCGTNAGSQSERRIRFILPARGFSRIKRMAIGQVLFWRF